MGGVARLGWSGGQIALSHLAVCCYSTHSHLAQSHRHLYTSHREQVAAAHRTGQGAATKYG
ncbi:hypothetical protein E2C01_061126 [Portunus trituberculatus]|uniref:Uncharacterized protein n=1 Tax=Portunus trituberculatus TaxID=210409 RepID=A0A5B7HCD4_PORTR|nr:hypothetical protein [Portunus trituberculatus]